MIQAVWRFPNGYGASVISGPYSYGVELAVVKFDNDYEDFDFELVYNTPVADNVIGHIGSGDELRVLLTQIQSL